MKKVITITLVVFLLEGLTASAQTKRDSTTLIKEAIVSAERAPRVPRAGTGSIEISRATVSGTPVLLGEADLLKTIQTLPGIKAGTEGLSGIYVRGGGPDENLIILDGMPVCSPGHLLGLFSVFQEEDIKSATVYKGAFPARFGGRASGIIDVTSPEGNSVKRSGRVSAGLLSDKFHLEGPVARGKTTYSLSGRGMHTLLLDGPVKAFNLPANYYFLDMHARVTHRLGDNDRITAGYFIGKDKLYYREDKERTDISWANGTGYIGWDRTWENGMTSALTAGKSSYHMNTEHRFTGEDPEDYRSGLEDLVVNVEFRAAGKGSDSRLRFGAGHTRHSFLPDMLGHETAIHVQDDFSLSGSVRTSVGLRVSMFSSGKTVVLSPEPRLEIEADAGRAVSVKAAYSRMSQCMHQLSPSLTTLPVDIWVPVTRRVRPVYSDQASLGLTVDAGNGWGISLEGYGKFSRNVLEYKDGVLIIDDAKNWEEQVATGLGRSAGVELLLRKETGKITGWLGYTLARSERRFPDGTISSGEWFPCLYDSRHDISMVLNARLSGNWEGGAAWTYSSGGAMTLPEPDGSMPHRGNYRLPASHRLDLGFKRHKRKRNGESILDLGLYNAYNRKNPNIAIAVSSEEDGSPGSIKTVSILPVIPSVGYTRVF